jgi:hypothetical protein
MKHLTLATQQAAAAAGARPCSMLGRGHVWNASVGMAMSSYEFTQDITTKRPARHLGGQPT